MQLELFLKKERRPRSSLDDENISFKLNINYRIGKFYLRQ
jgi:hypothetical protein